MSLALDPWFRSSHDLPVAKESQDERYVRAVLFEQFGVELRRLREGTERMPDYELLAQDDRAAILEVKTVELTPRTPENGWNVTPQGEHMWEATRRDNAPQRVGGLIHSAAGQLSRFPDPKILVFLNHESLVDVLDLEEAVQGYQPYGTEETGYLINTASKRIAEGRIREERWLIDLYVWIEPPKGPRMVFPVGPSPKTLEAEREATVFLRVASDAGLALAHRFFGSPADLPKTVPPWLRSLSNS